MKVIVKNNIYQLNKEQKNRILELVSNYVPYGVYAVEKGGIVELKDDVCVSGNELKKLVNEYRKLGFKVYYNGRF